MRDENRDPVTDDAGTGSDEARLFVPAGRSSNRSEESIDTGGESDEEGGVEGVEEDEEEDLDEEDLDEDDEDEDEDLLEDEDDEDDDQEAT